MGKFKQSAKLNNAEVLESRIAPSITGGTVNGLWGAISVGPYSLSVHTFANTGTASISVGLATPVRLTFPIQ